jgi:hypothetical protein
MDSKMTKLGQVMPFPVLAQLNESGSKESTTVPHNKELSATPFLDARLRPIGL